MSVETIRHLAAGGSSKHDELLQALSQQERYDVLDVARIMGLKVDPPAVAPRDPPAEHDPAHHEHEAAPANADQKGRMPARHDEPKGKRDT